MKQNSSDNLSDATAIEVAYPYLQTPPGRLPFVTAIHRPAAICRL